MPRIMVVDGDIADPLETAFKRRGFEVESTIHGEDAEPLFAGGGFDAVLLGDLYREVDVLGLIKQWRSGGFSGPIILMTTADERGREAVQLGATAYVLKPFELAELYEAVDDHLPPKTPIALTILSVPQAAVRLRIVVRTLRELRINSIHEEIAELERICLELDMSSDIKPDKSLLDRILPIFERLFDELGSERGAQVIISGAVAGLVSLAGVPALAAYSLTLAVWQGKEAFIAAAKAISSSKDKAD